MPHNPSDDFNCVMSEDWTALTLSHPQYSMTITHDPKWSGFPHYTAMVLLDGVQALTVSGRLTRINGRYRLQYNRPTDKGLVIRLTAKHQQQLIQIYEIMSRHMEWVLLDVYLPRMVLAINVRSYDDRIKRLTKQIEDNENELADVKNQQENAAQKLRDYMKDFQPQNGDPTVTQ